MINHAGVAIVVSFARVGLPRPGSLIRYYLRAGDYAAGGLVFQDGGHETTWLLGSVLFFVVGFGST